MVGSPCVLVVGATSTIGGPLLAHCAELGVDAVGSGRHGSAVDFDLVDDDPRRLARVGATHAVVLAARSSIADCERDPRATRAVNVEATHALTSVLSEAGILVTLVSSSTVFQRDKRLPMPDDPVSPVCEYGRQKADMERRCLSIDGTRVVRLTKVLAGSTILDSWAETLRAGGDIEPLANLTISPVRLPRAVSSILSVALGGGDGRIVHLSATDELNYAEMAQLLCTHMGIDAGRVHPMLAVNDPIRGLLVGPHAALGQAFVAPGEGAEDSETAVMRFLDGG